MWIQKKYVENVIKYKSPAKAHKIMIDDKQKPVSCWIRKDGERYTFSLATGIVWGDWKVSVAWITKIGKEKYKIYFEEGSKKPVVVTLLNASEVIIDYHRCIC
jgi:hypothetical protein